MQLLLPTTPVPLPARTRTKRRAAAAELGTAPLATSKSYMRRVTPLGGTQPHGGVEAPIFGRPKVRNPESATRTPSDGGAHANGVKILEGAPDVIREA